MYNKLYVVGCDSFSISFSFFENSNSICGRMDKQSFSLRRENICICKELNFLFVFFFILIKIVMAFRVSSMAFSPFSPSLRLVSMAWILTDFVMSCFMQRDSLLCLKTFALHMFLSLVYLIEKELHRTNKVQKHIIFSFLLFNCSCYRCVFAWKSKHTRTTAVHKLLIKFCTC